MFKFFNININLIKSRKLRKNEIINNKIINNKK